MKHVSHVVLDSHDADCVAHTYLDERLDLGLLLELRLAHLLGDLARVAIDSGDQRMAELLLGGTVIERLDDNGLATGVTSTQDDYDFASFHNLTHLSVDSEESEQEKHI